MSSWILLKLWFRNKFSLRNFPKKYRIKSHKSHLRAYKRRSVHYDLRPNDKNQPCINFLRNSDTWKIEFKIKMNSAYGVGRCNINDWLFLGELIGNCGPFFQRFTPLLTRSLQQEVKNNHFAFCFYQKTQIYKLTLMIPPSESTFWPDSHELSLINSHASGWSIIYESRFNFIFFIEISDYWKKVHLNRRQCLSSLFEVILDQNFSKRSKYRKF